MKTPALRLSLLPFLLLLACSTELPATGSTDAGGARDGGTGPDAGYLDEDAGLDPCAQVDCPFDQHCEAQAGQPVCVPNTCASLGCSATELCVETATGAWCEDNTCSEDLDCADWQFCRSGVCTEDLCTPGARRCHGQQVVQCQPNGGSEEPLFTCEGSAEYPSECTESGADAFCPCRDDWDCPAFSTCDAGACRGTGAPPTCLLPPEPFANVLPTNEITWGGTAADPNATGSPFPASSQVVMTPLVANLDDDNGDGRIDERDFPEILFLTFCNSEYTTNGVLRAIHGGGPGKGGDYFAACGATTWREGDALDVSCACADADLDSTSSLAVGDLDGDGIPEIVAITEDDRLRIYSNTGAILLTTADTYGFGGANPAPTLANLDNEGLAEIVVGRRVFVLARGVDGTGLLLRDHFVGDQCVGKNGQGPVSCVADLVGDARAEIVAGSTVYALPRRPAGVASRDECTGGETGEDQAWCQGRLLVVWDGQAVNGATEVPDGRREGFCAVADLLGADQARAPGPLEPLDGVPEVLTISAGWLHVFNGQDGTLVRRIDLAAGGGGGPPNVDDFDGDGFPEVGSAFAAAYVLADFQDSGDDCPPWPSAGDGPDNLPRTPPELTCAAHDDCGDPARFACAAGTSRCICLHNGWRRATEDDSSRVTGSSVFDFNGDGAAEVVYNDECNFRVYDGLDGSEQFKEPSESRTRIEYPVVADVDNDGNAEIVFATSNESGFCSENQDARYNAGLEVWGDASDLWVSARRIWNQHAYHVTNVSESGAIPAFEPPAWREHQGRLYNSYRSNPRSIGIAPDLAVQTVQISSPGTGCGQLLDQIEVTARVVNRGDLRVGPGVAVSAHGTWAGVEEPLLDGAGAPLVATLQNSLEPGESNLVTFAFDAANTAHGTLPDSVRVVVDDTGQERECDETNNELSRAVASGDPMADLRVAIEQPAGCPQPEVPTTVSNDGSQPASAVLVRYYAGDPAAGGTALHDELFDGPIAAGASESRVVKLSRFTANQDIRIYAVVDPEGAVEECNVANNGAMAPEKLRCTGGPN